MTLGDEGLAEQDGVEAKVVVIEQQGAALELIHDQNPARITTLGGERSVSVAPFSVLAERYRDDLAVVWIDSHPDVDTSLTAFAPDELRTSSAGVVEWLAGTGCSKVAIHLDVDTIDSREVVFGVGAEPDGLYHRGGAEDHRGPRRRRRRRRAHDRRVLSATGDAPATDPQGPPPPLARRGPSHCPPLSLVWQTEKWGTPSSSAEGWSMRSWRTSEVGSLARVYAWLVVRLRWFIVLGWAAVAVAAAVWLPATTQKADLGAFAPPNSRAIQTETESVKAFGFPALSRTVLVQRDEHGLSQAAQQRVVERAVAVAKHTLGDVGPIAAVVPIANTSGVFPSSSEQGTTALTYVVAKPKTTFAQEVAAADRFGREHINQPDDHLVGVTGTVPAQVAQSNILYDHLPLLEAATLAVVIAVVALKFRSVIAPLVALVTAGASYFLALRATNYVGSLVQGGVPEELKPLVLALVLGIVTDYAIFFLASMRTGLEEGLDRLTAAQNSAAQTGRIVLVAGIAVAAGSAAMLVAKAGYFRAFGPVLSVSVLTAVVVSVTLLPALLGIFGRRLFWPTRPRRSGRPVARAAARLLTVRVIALVLGGACVVGLGVLGANTERLRLGVSFVAALPADSQAHSAAQAAASGFAPGIVAPTELLLQGPGVGTDQQKLASLGQQLKQQAGVAGVLGPGSLPEDVVRGALVNRTGDAARFLLILDHEPLGATAIHDVNQLSKTMPALLQSAGLDGTRYGLAGDTAVSSELVAATNADLRRIAVAVLVVNLLLLMAFLRAIVAPVLLLGCSVLALAASLGCLTVVFQDWLGNDGVTFYVPFAASVLLLSLGSDYNIYGVGHVWTLASKTTLRKAIAERVPETSGAITAAGFTLAATFGMLALVPLRQFRELAFVMGVGVLLDALVVRSVVVPALLTLLGNVSAWPRKLERARPPEEPRSGSRQAPAEHRAPLERGRASNATH